VKDVFVALLMSYRSIFCDKIEETFSHHKFTIGTTDASTVISLWTGQCSRTVGKLTRFALTNYPVPIVKDRGG